MSDAPEKTGLDIQPESPDESGAVALLPGTYDKINEEAVLLAAKATRKTMEKLANGTYTGIRLRKKWSRLGEQH